MLATKGLGPKKKKKKKDHHYGTQKECNFLKHQYSLMKYIHCMAYQNNVPSQTSILEYDSLFFNSHTRKLHTLYGIPKKFINWMTRHSKK